jgi:hypothetical protein
LTRITIGENVDLGDYYRPAFERNFDEFYRNNGSKAGTYIYNGHGWTYNGASSGDADNITTN